MFDNVFDAVFSVLVGGIMVIMAVVGFRDLDLTKNDDLKDATIEMLDVRRLILRDRRLDKERLKLVDEALIAIYHARMDVPDSSAYIDPDLLFIKHTIIEK